jgi:hypothetical protein
MTQLYWHTEAPSYPALGSIPDNRVYVSPDAIDQFLRSYLSFTRDSVAADDKSADAALIGKHHTTCREIHITSGFGNTVVFVTDGHLPYPYGEEVAGYAVANVSDTIGKADAAGAKVPHTSGEGR